MQFIHRHAHALSPLHVHSHRLQLTILRSIFWLATHTATPVTPHTGLSVKPMAKPMITTWRMVQKDREI